METLKLKKLSFSARLFTRAVAALSVMIFMAACGNKGGDSAPPNTLLGITNCATCATSIPSATAIDVFSAKNATGLAQFANMQLIVSATMFTPGASSAYNLYTGPVAVQGQFIAGTTLVDPAATYGYGNSCTIPAGTYVMQSSTVGQMSLGMLQLPELISTTGVVIRMRVDQGMLYKDATTQQTRMYGSVYITSVNGVPCSSSFSDVFN
ncbi:MAG TPA: hypothetical protein VF412_05865 [Bdellovibrio sp.]|uniref:hypothetical protein n=1 Tax=Bdellovibrio sp. TaxID=28201 RepID=UPI002F21D0D1